LIKFIILIIIIFLTSLNSRGQTVRSEQAKINEIKFVGTYQLKESDLKRAVRIKEGSVYSADQLKDAAKQLQSYLLESGYLYARIDSVAGKLQNDPSKITVQFYGSSGEPVYFGEIGILPDSLKANSYSAVTDLDQGMPYSEKYLEKTVQTLLSLAADSGFLNAEASIDDYAIKNQNKTSQVSLNIRIQEKERIRISKISFRGNSYTRDHVLFRELPVAEKEIYSRKKVAKIKDRLNRLGLLKEVRDPVIVMKDKKNIALVIEVVEGNNTSFDGVIGYIPGETARQKDGYFTGLIDLSLHNLFGTGRRLNVYWKKPDRLSEEFELSYLEPWLFDYPLDAGVGLERLVRDTTYVEWQYEFSSSYRLGENFSIISRIHRKLAFPDSAASREQRLLRNSVLNGEIGLVYDIRDYPLNPGSGFYYRNTYSYGFKENFGPSFLFDEEEIKKNERIETINVNFEWYQRTISNQVIALNLTAQKVSGNRLQLTDYFWFGGSRSLRGYRENQFRGEVVSWANLEYRFLLGRNSRIFVFNDWGFYRDSKAAGSQNKTYPGYGIGIRLDTGLGIMAVDYGLGKGDSFSEGKIHFGLINRF